MRTLAQNMAWLLKNKNAGKEQGISAPVYTSSIFIFSFSLIAFIISFTLLMRYGAYEMEYGGGTVVLDGGWFMIAMNVVRLMVLLALCIISGKNLCKSKID